MPKTYTSWAGTFELDDQTGLPVLPEGYFWRVKNSIDIYWGVQLRRRRRGWFSKKLRDSVSSGAVTRLKILEDCAYILGEMIANDGPQWWSRERSNRSWFGDYPPKSVDTRGD